MVRTLEKQQESIGMNINVILADQNDSIGALEAGDVFKLCMV